MINIKDNVQSILNEIKNTALNCGRNPEEIRLIAVTKTHPASQIDEVIKAGVGIFAENKVQEAEIKLPEMKEKADEFHFIGHLQSNKINKLMRLNPDLIHSIDKLSTAQKLDEVCEKMGMTQRILIEINTSGEISKNGMNPDDLLSVIPEFAKLTHIKVEGLMTIGALSEDETTIRKCFQLLRTLAEQVKTLKHENVEMKHLSMGMSHDFQIAIEEGATLIRVGTLLFGERIYFKQ